MGDRSDSHEALTKLYIGFTKSVEKNNSRRLPAGNTRNGIRRFHFPAHLGGSGKILGGVHDNKVRN